MKLISASTFFAKRLFPISWILFVAWYLVVCSGVLPGKAFSLSGMVTALVLVCFGFVFIRLDILHLVDEVRDAGYTLVVRNGGIEEKIPLANIVNVAYASGRRPRITLTLREPCAFGREIGFFVSKTFLPTAKHPLAVELVERIDAERMKTA